MNFLLRREILVSQSTDERMSKVVRDVLREVAKRMVIAAQQRGGNQPQECLSAAQNPSFSYWPPVGSGSMGGAGLPSSAAPSRSVQTFTMPAGIIRPQDVTETDFVIMFSHLRPLSPKQASYVAAAFRFTFGRSR